jgi:hypothetical protein
VIILVGSVTSTCFLSNWGDIRTLSEPMVSGSSGTLPGQIAITCGLSAAATGHTMQTHADSHNLDNNRMI